MKTIKLLCEVRSAIAIQIEAKSYEDAAATAYKMGLLPLKQIEETTETITQNEEQHATS